MQLPPGDGHPAAGPGALPDDAAAGEQLKIQSQVFQSQTILQTIRSLKKSQKMSSLKNPIEMSDERSFERSFYMGKFI